MCRQYDDMCRKLESCYGVGSPVMSEVRRGGSKTSIVERQADAAAKYRDKIEKIERAARDASKGSAVIYTAIMKNVCQGIAYEHISVPCGRRQFYEARRVFFWTLDRDL